MLTEIEWWGGLLFIWMAFCWGALAQEYKGEPKLDVNYISLNATYVFIGTVLAMYFYQLESSLAHNLFLGAIILGALFGLLSTFWPESESMKAREAEAGETEGKGVVVIGWILFQLPILIVLTLGIYKSREFIGFLSFLQ